jgi:hypothetical protein
MVNASVKLQILCGLLLCLLIQIASAALRVTADSNELELGKPLWLTLTSDQTAVPLDTLDFSPWLEDFVMPRYGAMSLSRDQHGQRLRLHLFPLREGAFVLPALSLLQDVSNTLDIQVTGAVDAKSHSPIAFDYQISTQSPWQRQQVIVTCQLTTRDPYVVFEQPEGAGNGMQLLPMRVQHFRVYQDDALVTRYRLGWVLIAERAGQHSVQLPPIHYLRDGVVTHRFYLPPLKLQVQALPTWLPGTIPVGKVSVSQYRLAQSLINSRVLSHLQLQIQLDGVAPAALPDYPRQLRSDDRVQFYTTRRRVSSNVDKMGIRQQLDYDIPLIGKRLGFSHLPTLRLQYFDPDSGTLKTMPVHGPWLLILNPWIEAVLLLLAAMLLGWGIRVLSRWLAVCRHRYRGYQQALGALSQARTLAAVKQVMQQMAQAEGWPANLTYRQWYARMQRVTTAADTIAVEHLNAASYGRGEIAIEPVLHILMRICRQRRLAWR